MPSRLPCVQCLEEEGSNALPQNLAVNIRGQWHKVAAAYSHEREWPQRSSLSASTALLTGIQVSDGCRWRILRVVAVPSALTPAGHLTHTAAAAMYFAGYNSLNGYLSQPSNDIGLLALARPVSGPTVRLPKLSGGGLLGGAQAATSIPAARQKVWVAGYGQTETGESSDVLR